MFPHPRWKMGLIVNLRLLLDFEGTWYKLMKKNLVESSFLTWDVDAGVLSFPTHTFISS